jgi:hypothetical protein
MTIPSWFDPRMLIGPPFRLCPKCGQEELGTASISHRSFSRKCRACGHLERHPLPPIKKKLVYLDQMVSSGMAKTLDPVWAATTGPQDERWGRLFDALERAFKLQLIVCPQSAIHEKEGALASHPDMLKALYEHLGNGVEFVNPVIVHQMQLGAAFRAVLKGQAPTYAVSRSHILHGDPDEWMERLRISVNLNIPGPDLATRREVRERRYAAMTQWFERWKVEADKTFKHWYEFERQGHAINYRDLFRERLALLARVERGEVPLDMEDVWNPRLEAGVIPALMATAQQAGHPPQDALRIVLDFLFSSAAYDAPANDISALLMASLARKARSGQKDPPSPGMFNDITAIATYLPYCAAMYVDNECAGLLRDEPLRSKIQPFGTRIFSGKTTDEFFAYLAELERDAGADHIQRVADIYGEDWTQSYRTVLVYERERAARRAKTPDSSVPATPTDSP